MQTISLNGTWQVFKLPFKCTAEEGLHLIPQGALGMPAAVPGEIHLDLMRAGLMPDPDVGSNILDCRWVETYSWWYRTVFQIDAALLDSEEIRLVCEGLDLAAWLFVNGVPVGKAENAFISHVFDIKTALFTGENELIVRLTAGSELAKDITAPGQGRPFMIDPRIYEGEIPNPIQPGEPYSGRWWHGKKWLRKAQFMYGWDWCNALPNIGIWKDVAITCQSYLKLSDVRISPVRLGSIMALELDAFIENLHYVKDRRANLKVTVTSPQNEVVCVKTYALDVTVGGEVVRELLPIEQPQLWYPNGMGSQPLYRVTLELCDPSGASVDRRELTVGLRTIRLVRTPLETGSRFCFEVNGQECFCRGANIGPLDTIPARLTAADYTDIVAKCRAANMNMLRINGCSIYEHDAFYDACDRMGILVWQDFMLTDTTYPEEDAFKETLRREAVAVVKRLRHHACLALWCGNNECQQIFDIWNKDQAIPKDLGGKYYYNSLLPDVCRLYDPHTPYWPGSPCGGDFADYELAGDNHWWYSAYMSPDKQRRVTHQVFDECRARFVSEFGAIAPCHLDSINQYLAAEDQHPASLAWKLHTNMTEDGTVAYGIDYLYADAAALPLPEFITYGQMFQSEILRNAVEALRFRKHDAHYDCQGALIWSLTDCRGETGWSVIDYYHRVKAAYYGLRRACKPLKVIVRKIDGQYITRVVNDTLEEISATVEVGYWHTGGNGRDTRQYEARIRPNSMQQVAATPCDQDTHPEDSWIYCALLRNPHGEVIDQCIYAAVPYRKMNLYQAELQVSCENDWITVASQSFVHAVHAECGGRDLLSDNWFDLIPNVPNIITLTGFSGLPSFEYYHHA